MFSLIYNGCKYSLNTLCILTAIVLRNMRDFRMFQRAIYMSIFSSKTVFISVVYFHILFKQIIKSVNGEKSPFHDNKFVEMSSIIDGQTCKKFFLNQMLEKSTWEKIHIAMQLYTWFDMLCMGVYFITLPLYKSVMLFHRNHLIIYSGTEILCNNGSIR